MQKQLQKSLLAILFTSLTALPVNMACANSFPPNNPNRPSTTNADTQQAYQTAQQVYQIMLGEFHIVAGNYPQAYALMLDTAQQIKDDRLFEHIIYMAQHNLDDKMTLNAAKKWQQALPDSKDAHHFTLDILIKQQHFDQIAPAVQGMIQASDPGTRPEMIAAMGKYLAPHARQISPYYAQAMKPWIQGSNPEEAAAAWISIAIIELQAQHTEQAHATLMQAHTLAPDAKEPILFAIDLISPSYPQAETMVQEYLNNPNANSQVRLVYIQSLLQRQQTQQAKEQLTILAQNPDEYPATWYLLGMLQISDKQHAAGIQTLKTYLEKTQEDTTAETLANRDRAYLELAQAEVETGQPKAAQQWLNRINNPEAKASAQNTYIGILVEAQNYDQALQIINQMPEDNAQQRNQKSALYAQVLVQAQRWPQAYQYLEKANTQNTGDNPHLLYLHSIAATETGHYKQAENLLRRLIQTDPTNATAMNALGYLLAERNTNLEEAKTLLQQALKLEPNNPAALDTLGWIEFKRNNMDVALHLLERAYKNLPDPEVAAHYGQALWVSNQRDQALAIWKMALTQDPEHKYLRNTLKKLGVSLATVKNFELHPQNQQSQENQQNNVLPPITLENLPQIIEILYIQQEWEKLYNLLTFLNTKEPIVPVLDLQAQVASKLGRDEEAETLYRQAIEAEPQNAMLYNNLGYILSAQPTRLLEAKELIEKANELNPNSAAILDSLGWVNFKLGNNDLAITQLRQAYRLNPGIAEIGIHLGEALWQNNAKAEALLIWKDIQYQYPQGTTDRQFLEETLKRLQIKLP